MPLTIRAVKAPLSLGRQCYRAFSCTPRACDDALTEHEKMQTLAPSKSESKPSYILNAAKRQGSTATKLTEAERELNNTHKYFRNMLARSYLSGDVYSPHDLSASETAKYTRKNIKPLAIEPRRGRMKPRDICDALKFNPVLNYKNIPMLSEFVNETGQIMPARRTGLRPVNQRKMAKAIRRAVALGLMPSVHKHPLVLDPKNAMITEPK